MRHLCDLVAALAAFWARFLAFNAIPPGVAQNASVSRFHPPGLLIFRTVRANLSARISGNGGRASPGGARV